VKKDWFNDAITAELIKYSIALEKRKPHAKKVGAFEKDLDKIIDMIFEIFPSPYQL
jgi:hypothetical protein